MNANLILKRKVHLAVGAAIAILIAMGVLSYRATVASSQSDEWVRHSLEVLENLQDIAFAMVSIESNTRAFGLTGDQVYLQTTDMNIESVWQHFTSVGHLTADNTRQQARLPYLKVLIDRKIEFIKMIRTARLAGNTEEADRQGQSGRGRVMMNDFLAQIQDMRAEEQGLLAQRIVESRHRSEVVKAVLVFGTVLALLITAIASWIVERDSQRRAIAEEARDDAEEKLFEEKERAQVTLNSIGDAVACTDISGRLTFLNAVAEKMAGWSWQEAADHQMPEVLRILNGMSREAVPDLMALAISCDRTIHLPANSVLIRKDGFEIPIEDSVAPIHDRQKNVTGAVIVFRDVSATRAAALQISYSAEHDFLTKLPNRVLLNDRIRQAIALSQRHKRSVAILFLDLDGFKHINDSLGHQAGDKLLQSVAVRLIDCVRASDTVSRQGGDEFVVLLSEVDQPENAMVTAKRILNDVAMSHSIDGRDLYVTTSIGVSVYPDDGLDAETLIKNADTAMYQAKENGRQGIEFFKPAMNVKAIERHSIEVGLRRALEQQEFTLHYQPKIDLKTGAITGAEALIRWTDPTQGLISPATFIPIAEACGLIQAIDAWVLLAACEQFSSWQQEGLPKITIGINVSAREFQDEEFANDLFTVLDRTGVFPNDIELELTERVFMYHPDTTAAVLRTLRAKGIKIAIDDFGTGYSSLSYLRKFPVDKLKIDQSFIHQISTGGGDRVLVATVIRMAQSLKLQVIAEGVETLDQLRFLKAHQCDEAQGYYFSPPVPAQQFASLLKSGISWIDCIREPDI